MKKSSFRNNFFNPLSVKKTEKKISSKNKKKKFTWKTALNILLYTLLSGMFGIALLFAWFSKDLPTPGKIKHRAVSQSSQIFASDGKTPLYSISGEFKRTVIKKEQMPKHVRQATIAIEDKDFYRHIGIDIKGISRAVVYRILNKSNPGGGSTITQQFVKNALLTTEHTLTRKIKEAILSLEVEIMYSKEDILTMYLNEIPYGSNAYGIESASHVYYNKKAADLTLNEAATLASIVRMPTYYYNHQDLLESRKNITLRLMYQQGYITKEEMTAAQAEPIVFIPREENIQAPHFVMYVKEVLVQKYGEKMVESGGLKVVTSLDMNKQRIAEEVVADSKSHLKKYGASNTALVSLDPKTGQILAMVGSLDYFDTSNNGNYNVATGKRQPGSSIKPLVYASAFEGKYNPGYILYDLQTDFGKYIPKNYDGRFRGPVTIRYALGNSLNIPAVKALGIVGVDKFVSNAAKWGLTTYSDPGRYGLSLALGSGEVRPLDIATAYGVFANNGVLAKTSPIIKVTDANGKILEEAATKQSSKKVMDPQVAYEINNILSDINAKKPVFNFTLNNLTLKNRPVASKTGTTNDYKDAWTVGYTPSLVTAVWAGNNNNKAMSPSGGSIGAAPIWHSYMEKALADTKVEQFARPSEIKEITVEKYSNKLPSEYSKDFVKDIFATWQAPTERDDVNIKLRVCIGGGLLAPKNMPDSQVEQRIYSNIHSEIPDKPNWENPVKVWAQSHGLYQPAPTKYCKIGEVAKPEINITEPVNGAQVTGVFTIKAAANYAGTISNIEFFIDDIKIGSSDQSPYSITYNANQLSAGNHDISARVNTANGTSAKTNITIKIGNDTTPPENPSSISTDSDGNKINLNWINSSNSDLSKVLIYFSNSNLSLGSLKGEYAAQPGSSQHIDYTGITGNPKCFTIRSVDTSGNENTSDTSSNKICL